MSILTLEVCLAALLALTTLGTGLTMVRNMKKSGSRPPLPTAARSYRSSF
ncbi:hypothetical protein [Noviherbaspirillum pedocola]|uniref:Uncharacterized protein n=1 Tax=Noviherbaspirillum pedocola TaxID=2801341 RepID=A0A934SM76_9BURK|nr:hypothetical protein [Noviherbaspirillum pedocola]MBK4733141.1 hypothetical protein [Noviherbaspirillum pedocola]